MAATRRPNVILLVTDDQGPGDLGCAGNPVLRTPALDALHADSVRLTDYHVGPTCAPTRAGLLTGHWANSTGVWHTIGGRSLLRRGEWTLAQALADGGYATGIFGKWHLGDTYPYRPGDRGFQTSVVHGGGGISQTPDHWGNDYFDDTYLVNGQPRAFHGYCTDVFFSEATRYIEAHRHEPFFCYLATNAPHEPFNVEPAWHEPYDGVVNDRRARFYGMIACIDDNLRRLRQRLAELDLADDTLLVFMTDNGTAGGCTLDRDGFVTDGYNAGLRGVKGSPYDGGHRTPCWWHWPAGRLTGGRDIAPVTANVDVMPTLLALCDVPVPPERAFHGVSLAPLLRGEPADWPARAVVTDSQRLTEPVKWRQSAVCTDAWRLINGAELYDAAADREQRHDVAAAHPAVVAELRAAYEGWWEVVSTQFDDEVPTLLGPDVEVTLTGHDWRNEQCDCPWNQSHIRAGHRAEGYWEVEVTHAGPYRVDLRRWPAEAGHALTAGVDGDDVVWRRDIIAERDWAHYTGGTALAIERALVELGEVQAEAAVEAGQTEVSFVLELPAGPGHLRAWFTGADGLRLGAYYVTVSPAG